MSSIGIIPIRATSSRLPGKTFKLCAGKELISWTIESCCRSLLLDRFIVVSSSAQISRWCHHNRIEFKLRSEHLEHNDSPVLDTIKWINQMHVVRGFDKQVLLQITNPTRTFEDIDNCIEMLDHANVNSVCSVVDVGEYHPSRMFRRCSSDGIVPLCVNENQWMRTQDFNGSVVMRDGSIYAWKTKAFHAFRGKTLLPQRVVGYDVELSRSVRIDTQADFDLAERMLTRSKNLLSS